MTGAFTVYFAGALFDHKDLLGNAWLASYLEQGAAGRYVCVLPQNIEQVTARAVDIRNHDLWQIMRCDLALFNFDGTELDAGTVVEFMFAKLLDIPAVILRSDFRASGDQGAGGDAWNLMCSFYPRTQIVQLNAIAWYQQASAIGGTLQDILQRFYVRIAAVVLASLDAVRQEPPLPKGTGAEVARLYQWALRFPGGGLADYGADPAWIEALVTRKSEKGLV
jgi:Nucleoside 2-deoxyribosyltransferase